MGGSTTKTASTTNSPWPPATDAMKQIVNSAADLYNTGAGKVAQPSPYTLSGLSTLGGLGTHSPTNLGEGNAAANQLLTGTGAAGSALTATARGDNLAQVNPYLESQLQDQSDKIATQLRSIYSGAGRYGSSTMNQDLVDRLGAMRGGVLSTNWENERNRQLQAAGALQAGQVSGLNALQGLDDLKYSSANHLLQAGGIADARSQSLSDNPWTRLSNFANIVSGVTSGNGTTTSQQPGPSVLSQILGGVTGVGSMIGSLAPLMLSDERAKTDIRRVGETDGGLGIFTYRYRHDPAGPTHMGVLAQDAARSQPDAVGMRPDGLLAVDYGAIR